MTGAGASRAGKSGLEDRADLVRPGTGAEAGRAGGLGGDAADLSRSETGAGVGAGHPGSGLKADAAEPGRSGTSARAAAGAGHAGNCLEGAEPGRSRTGGEAAGRGGLDEEAGAGIGVAAQVSLAVAAKASAENFPVALRVLPKRWRAHLTALYGFARLVDDIGDEPLPGMPQDATAETVTATRLHLLDELRRDVQRIYDGDTPEPELAAIRALKRTVQDCGIPAQPLYDLIEANRQDQLVTRYQTYRELADYCTLSANPVGQVVLFIVGAATPERIAASDSICTALQIIEHCQDVAEDLGNGRIYLPREDMDAHGVSEADLAAPAAGDSVKRLVEFEADRAARLLDAGSPLVGTLKGAARLAIAGYVAGGRATLKALRASGYDVLRSTPRPGKADTLRLMAACYVKGR